MKKKERLKLLEGLDTSKMSRQEVADIIGKGLKESSIKTFIGKNKIHCIPTSKSDITRETLISTIDKLIEKGLIVTLGNIGKEMGFSKQRAHFLCSQFGLLNFVSALRMSAPYTRMTFSDYSKDYPNSSHQQI